MARLYANENFPRPVVELLRQLGHDVVTTQQSGQAGEGTPDAAVLALAVSLERAVLTINRRDFVRLKITSASSFAMRCAWRAKASSTVTPPLLLPLRLLDG